MNRSTGLLRAYTTLIRRVSGADSVCLFVPSLGERDPLLLQEGERFVPELASVDAARELVASVVGGEDGLERRESSCANGWLVGVPCGPTPSVAGSSSRRRRFEDVAHQRPTRCWLGLRFSDGERGHEQSADAQKLLVGADGDGDSTERPEGWASLVDLGGVLAWYAGQISSILDDPVTGLAGRAEFQASLSQAMDVARELGRPLSLLLVNPDDFTAVNESQGHDAGDDVLREIGARLRTAHRTSDSIAKYGGAIFASFLKDTDLAAARIVAKKVWTSLSETPYLDRTVRLGISVGLAVFDPKENDVEGHLELIRRADKALNAAKRFGGDHVIAWEERLDEEEPGSVDRLTGVYTGNMAKDYRNMTLLSETMTVVAGSSDVRQLAERVVEQLYVTLKADRVGIFELADDEMNLVKGVTKRARATGGHEPIDGLELGRRQRALVDDAHRDLRAVHASFTDDFSEKEVLTFAIPLALGERTLGCFYLDGRADTFALEGSSDLGFLRAFATQLAVAMDRARLREQQQTPQRERKSPVACRGRRSACIAPPVEARLSVAGDGRGHQHRAPGRANERDRPRHRRKRNRQGAHRENHSRSEPVRQKAARCRRLWRHSDDAHRKRALWPRAGRLHRGGRSDVSADSWKQRAERSSSTRSASFRWKCRASSCDSSKSARSPPSVARERDTSKRASSR